IEQQVRHPDALLHVGCFTLQREDVSRWRDDRKERRRHAQRDGGRDEKLDERETAFLLHGHGTLPTRRTPTMTAASSIAPARETATLIRRAAESSANGWTDQRRA